MVRKVVKRIGSGLRSFGHFVAALSHPSSKSSAPDPRKKIARQLMDATHVANMGEGAGGTAAVGTGNSPPGEKILGQVISDGYKQQR